MKWNLPIVAIAMAGILATASASWGQQYGDPSTGNRSDDSYRGSVAQVGDGGGARISVGDDSAPTAAPPVPLEEAPPVPAAIPYGYAPGACTSPCYGCTDRACGCAGRAYGCTDRACDPCAGYSYGPRCRSFNVWGGVEYLHSWTRGSSLPPLVTTSNAADEGVLDPARPSTEILFGNERIGNTLQPSGRLTAGIWTDDSQTMGVGGRLLALAGNRTSYFTDSSVYPVLARPFNNADPLVNVGNLPNGTPDSLLVGFPGQLNGGIDVRTSSDLYAAEAFLRVNLDQGCDYRVDLIAGYHFTVIDDGFSVRSLTQQVSGLNAGTLFDIRDGFNARNEFHGGELGFRTDLGNGPWTFTGLGKISIGQMSQTVTINGQSIVTDALNNQTVFTGGLLAQPTNIGTYTRNKVAFIPEVGFNLNCNLTRSLEFSVGYTFMYWSTVVLAGGQVDSTVNATQMFGGALAGPARPAHHFADTDYYLHAISFGLNYRF